jgi:6-phosphogluconolactonase (cycloisomerase 2 family)
MLSRVAQLFVLIVLSVAMINCGGNGNSGSSNNNSGGSPTPGGSNPGGTGTGGTGTGGGQQSSGNYVYAVSNGSLIGYNVSESGTFTALASLNSPQQLRTDQLTASPDGRFLYSIQNPCYLTTNCSGGGTNTLMVQTIAADGTLSTPTQALAGTDVIQIMISPGSKWAFVLSSPATNTVSVHSMNADGSLGAQTGSVQLPMPGEQGNPYSTLSGISPGNTTLWVAEELAFREGSTPNLIAIQYDASTGAVLNSVINGFSNLNEVESVAVTGTMVVTAESTYWTWIQPNTITTYRQSDMNMLQRCSGTDTPACNGTFTLLAHPTLSVVYGQQAQSNGGRTITAFNVGSDGALSTVGNTLSYAGAGATYWAVHPDGTRLVLSRSDQKTLTDVAIDPTTGALTELGSTTASDKTGAVVIVKK